MTWDSISASHNPAGDSHPRRAWISALFLVEVINFNSEQRKYIAEIVKIVAVAQFGLIGYTGLAERNLLFLIGSALIFVNLVAYGLMILNGEHDE